MKILTTLAVLSILGVGMADAHADGWTSHDTGYGTVAGALGGAGGALGGALAGSLLDGSCASTENDCLPAFTIAGAGAGLIIGSAAGVAWYGKRRGLNGSFRSAVLGALLGNIASGTVVVLAASTIESGAIGFPVVIGAMVGLPALGATIAYKRSVGRSEQRPAPQITSGALIDVTPERVKVQTPIVGFAVTPSQRAVLVTVAAGRF